MCLIKRFFKNGYIASFASCVMKNLFTFLIHYLENPPNRNPNPDEYENFGFVISCSTKSPTYLYTISVVLSECMCYIFVDYASK